MPEAIIIREYGGPEVLKLESIKSPEPEAHELLIRQTAVGINFHDTYVRSGLYKTLALPGIPGIEGVGEVVKIGADVQGFELGQRVGYFTSKYSGYSSERSIPAELAIPIPDGISDVLAASTIIKGLTVQMLTKRVVQLKPEDKILVHAAAGGVGQLLVQGAKSMGAEVIGTVGSEAKAAIAKEMGCDHVILYRKERVLDKVMEITSGKGLNVVFDSVGKDTFHDSLASLDYLGHLVNFGQASGPIEGFEIPMLAKKSLSLTRPMLFHYTRNRKELLDMSAELFRDLTAGKLKCREAMELPLAEASKAHELLESRKMTQPLVLIP
ncbi:MAG: quinone oxidoreductase [Bacteroidia bacterium]|nr:quinone oxidoreductase [Bacteroidia bacterium]